MRNNWFIFHQLAIFKINTNNYVNGFPGGSVVKNLPANARDTGELGLIPRSGRSPGGGSGNSLQYSCWKLPRTEKPGGRQCLVSQT